MVDRYGTGIYATSTITTAIKIEQN